VDPFIPLVEIRRGDVVESIHHGAIAMVDDGGRLMAAAGDPGVTVFLRSAAKPAQALPLLRAGGASRFGLDDAAIAVMIGSHSGEPFHLEAVRRILGAAGLDESALQCGAHTPFHRPTARALWRQGIEPGVLHNNCSGKHAGMLAAAVLAGADTRFYLEPDHPVQRQIRAAVETLAGLPAGAARPATDGCSAPTFAVPLRAAALLYARLAAPDGAPGGFAEALGRAADAMRARPEMVAGSDRLCTALIRESAGGVLAKIGAEGMFGLAFRRDGRGMGLALKIADGDGERARFSAALEALRQAGALPDGPAASLRERFVGAIRSHRGDVVGSVRTVFALG
jgi:L-asparaginase II